MTTTLILSTLLGAATSYPLLKGWTGTEAERLKVIEDGWRTLLFPLMAALLILPFFIYPLPHAMLIVLSALAAAWSRTLAVIILVGAFLVWSELWILLMILLFLSPLLLLVPHIRAAIKAIFEVLRELAEKVSLRGVPFLRIAVFAACFIIVSEGALLSAYAEWFLSVSPRTCAWIGGERSIPILMKSLRSPDYTLYSEARRELAGLGEAAVPALMTELEKLPSNDFEDRVWRDAAAALLQGPQAARLIESGKITIPRLISLLTHYDYDVRQSAAQALGKIGRPALPDLLAFLKQGHGDSLELLDALRRICVVTDIPSLLRVAKARRNTFYSLQEVMVSFGPDAISSLTPALDHYSQAVRDSARQALIRIGKPAVPSLLEVLRNGSPQTCREVVQALGNIGDPSAISPLTELLRSDDSRIRLAALQALNHMVWAWHTPSVPDLIILLNDNDGDTVRLAASILGRIGDKSALPALLQSDTAFHTQNSTRHDSTSTYPVCEAVAKLKAR